MRYCLPLTALWILGMGLPSPAHCQEQSPEEIADQLRPSVFVIRTESGRRCSGFLVSSDPPMIVTVASIVLSLPQGKTKVLVRNQDGDTWEAGFVHLPIYNPSDSDAQSRYGPDVALLELIPNEESQFGEPVPLKEKTETVDLSNQEVLLLGFSAASITNEEQGRHPKAVLRKGTVGRLLSYDLDESGDVRDRLILETDLTADGGDRGGPVFDSAGGVVGVYLGNHEELDAAMVLHVRVLRDLIDKVKKMKTP